MESPLPSLIGQDIRDVMWPIPLRERLRLAMYWETGPYPASASADGFRLATCVVCAKPMVAMWHLWVVGASIKKEIHMCHACATDVYGAPEPPQFNYAGIPGIVVADVP